MGGLPAAAGFRWSAIVSGPGSCNAWPLLCGKQDHRGRPTASGSDDAIPLRRSRILLECLYSRITPHQKSVPERFVRIVLKNDILRGDSTKRWDDFSKERPPIHFSYPTTPPAPVFRCKIDPKNPLTSQNSHHRLPPRKRKFLSINSIQLSINDAILSNLRVSGF